MTMRGMALMAAGAALLAGCSSNSSTTPPTNTISVENNRFNPSSLTVASGTAVTFNWPSGSTGHSVVPWSGNPSALPASPGSPALINGPSSFSVSFPAVGIYRFNCSAHGSVSSTGQLSGMAGSITVQ